MLQILSYRKFLLQVYYFTGFTVLFLVTKITKEIDTILPGKMIPIFISYIDKSQLECKICLILHK